MHLFPPVDELRYLVGTTLTQITIGAYEVSFLLTDGRAGITLTSGYVFEFKQSNGQTEVHKPAEKSSEFGSSHFHKLVDENVVGVDVSTDGLRLSLSFARGSQLTILSELHGYECGQIAGGGGFQKYWVF